MTNTTYTYAPNELHVDMQSGSTNINMWRDERGEVMLELGDNCVDGAAVRVQLDRRNANVLAEALERALCYAIPYGGYNPADTDIEWVLLTQGLMQMGFAKQDRARKYDYELNDDGDYISVTRCDDGAFELCGREIMRPTLLRTTSADELLAHAQRVIDLAKNEQALATYVQIDKALGEV